MKNVFEPCLGPSSLDDNDENVEEEPTTLACSPPSTPGETVQAPDKPEEKSLTCSKKIRSKSKGKSVRKEAKNSKMAMWYFMRRLHH